jgi:hypothetical protein
MLGLVVWELAVPDVAGMAQGRHALMVLAGVISISATVSGVVLATVPNLYDAWRDGIGYGRRQEARERRSDAPLRLVKH